MRALADLDSSSEVSTRCDKGMFRDHVVMIQRGRGVHDRISTHRGRHAHDGTGTDLGSGLDDGSA